MWLDVKKCLTASLWLPASLACSPSAAPGTAAAPTAANTEEAPRSDTGVATPKAGRAPGVEQAPAEQPSAASVMPDTPPDPARSLPEVTVRNVGLHIGGGSNDAASKEPFQRAVAARFESFLTCYRQVAEPQKGGVFGVDLFIKREGGGPEVRQPRTSMQGEAFRACVVDVFESVAFERPAKGPTVISYSLKFEVRDPNAMNE
ncbi:MAG TPA: hypothetical protein VI197_13545 [Polyangiaceae bacterium]